MIAELIVLRTQGGATSLTGWGFTFLASIIICLLKIGDR